MGREGVAGSGVGGKEENNENKRNNKKNKDKERRVAYIRLRFFFFGKRDIGAATSTAGLIPKYTHMKNQFRKKTKGPQQMRDQIRKALGENNPALL